MITICGDTNNAWAWLLWGLLASVGVACGWLLYRRRKARYRADAERTLSWAWGVAALMIALWPPLARWAHYDFRGHMLQHLLIGMVAPLGLVGAAPLTQLLRTRAARRLMQTLRSPGVSVLSYPATARLLNTGSLYLLYLTPFYAYTLTHPGLHALVHLHFLVAGCLFVCYGGDAAEVLLAVVLFRQWYRYAPKRW